MRKITLLIVSMVVMASLSSCEKKDYPPESYGVIGGTIYELTSASCYHHYLDYRDIYQMELYLYGDKNIGTNSCFAVNTRFFYCRNNADDIWPKEGIYRFYISPNISEELDYYYKNSSKYSVELSRNGPSNYVSFIGDSIVINKMDGDVFEIFWEGTDVSDNIIKVYYKGTVIPFEAPGMQPNFPLDITMISPIRSKETSNTE